MERVVGAVFFVAVGIALIWFSGALARFNGEFWSERGLPTPRFIRPLQVPALVLGGLVWIVFGFMVATH